jgi:hypothetical protein
MKRRRYNITYARSWYLNGRRSLDRVPLVRCGSWANRDVEAFVTALLGSLNPTMHATEWPDTFTLDTERLRVLKAELQGLLHEQIYCYLLGRLVESRRKPGVFTSGQRACLRAEIHTVVSDGRLSGLPFSNVIAELVRQALRLTGSTKLCDTELEDLAEKWLEESLSNPELLRKHADNLMSELSRELTPKVEKYLTSSPWDIFNALVAPTPSTQPSIITSLSSTGLAVSARTRRLDIINRITHLAVLHWRIWDDLIYNNEELDQRNELSPDSASRPVSPLQVPPSVHSQTIAGRTPSQAAPSDIDQTVTESVTQTATTPALP